MQATFTPELRALAQQAFQHQAAGRFAEAAQGYAAVLSRVPGHWQTCYNLGLVYQHLGRMPDAAKLYQRAVQLNPQFAEGFNNLGNVRKALKNETDAIDAYRRAIDLNPQLSDASYNLACIWQDRGDHPSAIELLRKTIAANEKNVAAWDALYRSLLALKRIEEGVELVLAWERVLPPSPELVAAGLALCRPSGNREMEERYLALAIEWPFADFTPLQLAPVLGMLQYFDITREQLLSCYRRYDAAVSARNPARIPLLPRRAADQRLRIGYLSGDFRRHVMGRWMLDVVSKHDRSRISVFLISTCLPREHDAMTAAFRTHADGFADISGLDDFAAAKSIAEADLDVLVDLVGNTMAARPGIYAHRPARSIVTHLGYHGCLGLSAVDYKLTDRIADLPDAADFQIERPFALETCVFPFARLAPADNYPVPGENAELEGRFVFAAFTNELKLSPRCLAVWKRVLDALPEAILLFSPPSSAQHAGIERMMAAAGIDKSRIAFLNVPVEDALWRARYRLVHAALDTFPYAGGDTTVAALDMGVPVVTLLGKRHSERVGASILTHLGMPELVANTEDEFVEIAVKLACNAIFSAQIRDRITTAVAATDNTAYARALERAFTEIAARKPVAMSMSLSARQFFHNLREATQQHRAATDEKEQRVVAEVYSSLRVEQPDYSPLLRVQGELAQTMGDIPLAADCAGALLRQFPDDVDVRLSSAGFLIHDGAAAEALNVLSQLSESGQGDVRALKLYARAHAKLGRWETALRYSAPAIALAPADVQALFWHGMALSHTGDAEAALTFLNRALILAPDHVEAAYNAGVILAELGNLQDAEKVFRRALGAPATRATAVVRISAHLRLLQLLSMQGRNSDWVSEGQRFISAYPEAEHSHFIDSRLARYRGDLEREAEILLPLAESATAMNDDVTAVELIGEMLATLSFHDVPAQLLQRLQDRFKDAARVMYSPLGAQPAGQAAGQIKVGYLADFSQPFIADFILMLASHHDRARVAVSIYAVSPVGPTVRDALVAAGTPPISVATFDERRAAQRIHADNVDILIELAAFGAYAKPGLWSCRPARVQLAMPGFTRPVGVGEFDCRLSDRIAELDVSGQPASPPPLLLDGCAFPLLAISQAQSQVTREQLGIPQDAPVFGVLAAAARLSSRCITAWKLLSERVPAAIFFVCPLNLFEGESVKRLLMAGGIDASRIRTLASTQMRPRDLSLIGVVDVVLDTLPGSDYFSARAAILDAIPLVTMSGRMFEERVALSLLSALGDASTVTASGRDYVEVAAQLACDAKARDARAQQMRAQLQSSGLLNTPAWVARFEDALVGAVADHAAWV